MRSRSGRDRSKSSSRSVTSRLGASTGARGACVVESEDDQLAEPALPWSGHFRDPAPAATLEEGRAWLCLTEEPVREGAIKITRAGSSSDAGLIDFAHVTEPMAELIELLCT